MPVALGKGGPIPQKGGAPPKGGAKGDEYWSASARPLNGGWSPNAPAFARGFDRIAPSREDAPFVLINKEITDPAIDPHRFQAYITQLVLDRRAISMVNVVT